MSKVGILLRVIPNKGISPEKLLSDMAHLKPANHEVIDIGFGIKALKVLFIVDSASGSNIDEEVGKLSSVSSVEIIETSLI
ncbi:MAG: hypothetical protein QW035_03745 [Candidatus Anstonellales archaeon]